MRSGYEVTGNTLFVTSKLHSSKRSVFLSMEDLEEVVDENPGITKIKLGHQAGGSVHYECSLDDLRYFIESSENLEPTLHKGREGYSISIDDSPFVKVVNKSSDGDKWLAQRAKIIQEGGGPWTEEQRLTWRDKFSYRPPVKHGT